MLNNSYSKLRGLFLSGTTGMVFAISATPTFAQDEPTATTPTDQQIHDDAAFSDNTDIVVVARGRQERLQDVPVAASVLNPQEIDRVGNNIASLTTLVPSLRVSRAGAGNGGSISLRGVATSIANAALEQKVAINIDDVQIARARVIMQGFFDTQSVQVLKGPQALFFGKNATAGVVSIQSAEPGPETEGYARAGYETEASEYAFEGAISTPLTSTLRVRVAGRYSHMTKGYIRNDAPIVFQTLDNAYTQANVSSGPRMKQAIGRIALVWEPAPTFTAKLKVSLASSRTQGSRDGIGQSVCAPGQTNQGTTGGVPAQPFDDCQVNSTAVWGTLPANIAAGWPESRGGFGFADYDGKLASLNMNYKFGNLTLTSITGYYKLNTAEWSDSAYTAYTYTSGGSEEDYHQISQELRLASNFDSPFNFTVGAFWQNTSRKSIGTGRTRGNVPPDPRNGRTNQYSNLAEQDSTTLSAFAQFSWKFLPGFELAGGARYTHDERNGRIGNTFLNQTTPGRFLAEGLFTNAKTSSDDISPEVTLSYKPSDDVMIYAAYRTASLAGGITAPSTISATTVAKMTYAPESVEGFEGGVKFTIFDRALRGNLTAFRYTYRDLQTSAFDSNLFTYLLDNVGKARSEGIEVSLDYSVTPELSLRTEAAWVNSKYISFPGAQCYSGQTAAQGCTPSGQDLSGRTFPRAPKFSLSASATYDTPISANWNLGLSTDLRHSSSYIYVETMNPVAFQKAYTTIDAGVRLYNDDWELAFIGRNLGNVYYATVGNDQPSGRNSQVWTFIGRPRELLFQVTRRF